MKSAVVTGGTGFIGTHLVNELMAGGVSVTVLSRTGSANYSRLSENVRIIEYDIDGYGSLDIEPPDVFYHLAWEGSTGLGRGDEIIQSRNAIRCLEAVKAAKHIGCGKFIALGTVYEKLSPQIIGHKDLRQADFYLLSKEYAHNMCSKLANKLDINFIWATIFQPIGKYIKPDQLTAYAIKSMLGNKKPSFGPGGEPFDITAVENIAYGLYLLGKYNVPHDNYYIGGGAPKRLYEYLHEIQKILNADIELGIGDLPDSGLSFDFDWYDITQLANDTGYAPKINFEQAVINTACWIRESLL